jgi:hypothetical protein
MSAVSSYLSIIALNVNTFFNLKTKWMCGLKRLTLALRTHTDWK